MFISYSLMVAMTFGLMLSTFSIIYLLFKNIALDNYCYQLEEKLKEF